MPKYIVDQNMLNDAPTGIAPMLAARADLTVVVPDTAFVEMMKSEEWELTMALSLRELAAHATRVEMSIAVGEALENELRKKQPTTTLILPLHFRTRSIRNVAPVVQVERGVTAQPVAA